jgi:hypothetical protein
LPKLPAKVVSSRLLSGTIDTDDPARSLIVKHGDKLEITVHRIAKNMSWDAVVKNYLLPSLQKALHKHRSESIYTKT